MWQDKPTNAVAVYDEEHNRVRAELLGCKEGVDYYAVLEVWGGGEGGSF